MRMRKSLMGILLLLAALFTLSFTALADKTAPEETARTQVKQENGRYYLYDTATDQKVTGLRGVYEYPSGSGDVYFFRYRNGQVFVNRLIKKKGNYYYAGSDGRLASGFTQIKNYTYYFHPATRAAVKGWRTIEGKRYYFNTRGIQLTGFQTIKKSVYYLDPANGGARVSGWAKVGRKWYYFNKKGRRQTGVITDTGTGQRYFLDAYGIRRTGLKTWKGAVYYFDKKVGTSSDGRFIGGAMVTGWRKVRGKTYYFSSSGKAVTGWLNQGGKKYYFNSNGVMQTGSLVIGSKTYVFDKTSGALKSTASAPTGPYSIKVNQTTCVVTIYRGLVPVKAMLCSVGLNGATPNGTFSLSRKIHWQPLFGNCYGQYTSTITGNILFHSVFYYRYKDDHSLATAEYRKLGQPASHGCVRLNCADAYYIYTNCPNGTKVTIFRGTAKDDPLGKPANPYANWTGNYDPTDPIPGD